MIIHEITEECFRKYGKVIDSIDLTELVSTMQTVEIPADVVYEPSISALEKLKCATELQQKTYGELPIQIGWCIGNNHKLNAVEYHRCSEVNIAATDAILILGRQQDISVENTYDTSLMEAFRIPSGTAVELYATTLHYAPCNASAGGFLVAVVLPKGTNEALEHPHTGGEDALLAAKNKWLIGHPEGGLPDGSYIGLTGENLEIK